MPSDVWIGAYAIFESRLELFGITRGARGCAQDDDGIARAHASVARSPVSLKRAARVVAFDLLARRKRVELVRHDAVFKIGHIGKVKGEVAQGEGVENLWIASVIPRGYGARGNAKRQAPREQGIARCNGLNRKAMAFEDGMPKRERVPRMDDPRALVQRADRNADVVSGQWETTDFRKSVRFCHVLYSFGKGDVTGRNKRKNGGCQGR